MSQWGTVITIALVGGGDVGVRNDVEPIKSLLGFVNM